MNKEWSEMNKLMQLQLKKEESFNEGIHTFMELRNSLFDTMLSFRKNLSDDELCAMPFINAKGYQSKSIAYSLWHIFRIEDIVGHTLINGDKQMFFDNDYQQRMNAPIITTGNELKGEQIREFSRQLNMDELFSYISDVKKSSESMINNLSFVDLRRRISEERKQDLIALEAVSRDENAFWLINYWCNKNVRGLIQMPFSRHWIMHVEACIKIENKLL